MERWGSRKRQSGATAIEFALVFPVAFALLYASLMFGFVLLIRLGLQHSAEDGAREALRYPIFSVPNGSTADQRRQLQIAARIEAARARALQQASWMNGWSVPEVGFGVCQVGVECPTSTTPTGFPDCGETMLCQIVVTLTYPYADHPVVPSIPGFGLIAPQQIKGRARVLFDGRALNIQ